MECLFENNIATLRCGAYFDLASIKDQLPLLKKLIESKKQILIEAKDITRIDTAGLQLLLSFYLSCFRHGLSVQWVNPSITLIQAATLIGVDQLLGLTHNEKGRKSCQLSVGLTFKPATRMWVKGLKYPHSFLKSSHSEQNPSPRYLYGGCIQLNFGHTR